MEKILKFVESKRNNRNVFWRGILVVKDFFRLLSNLRRYFLFRKAFPQCISDNRYFYQDKINLSELNTCSENITNHKKINLKDVSIIIPFYYDFQDRIDNLLYLVKFLKRYFNINIIVGEQGPKSMLKPYLKNELNGIEYYYFKSNKYFYRTKISNILFKKAKGNIISLYDCDMILNPIQIFNAVQYIRKGFCDVVYPYCYEPTKIYDKNLFFNNFIFPFKLNRGRVPLFDNTYIFMGGVFFIDKNKLLRVGGESEYFRSWGREDDERYTRFKTLGLRVKNVYGLMYHLEHRRLLKGSNNNPYLKKNDTELKKIKSMNQVELETYIQSSGHYIS